MSDFYNSEMEIYNIIVSVKGKHPKKEESAYELGAMDRLL